MSETHTTVWLVFFADPNNRKALFFDEVDADAYVTANPTLSKREARLDAMQLVNLTTVDL